MTGRLPEPLFGRSAPGRNPAPWPATVGLAGVLVLAATAWWRLGGEARSPEGIAGAAPSSSAAAAALRLAVAADGSITMSDEGNGTRVELDGLAPILAASRPARTVELMVDPRRHAQVDALLSRLRDAGVLECALGIAGVDEGVRGTGKEGGP